MMASRKAVLDKNKRQLLDSVNATNKVYTNEELSILIGQQQELIELQNANIQNLTSKLNHVSVDLKEVQCTYSNFEIPSLQDFNPGANFSCTCPAGYQYVGYSGSVVLGDYWTWLSLPTSQCNGTTCQLAGHNYGSGPYRGTLHTYIMCMKLNK